jgi:hypothetical protein
MIKKIGKMLIALIFVVCCIFVIWIFMSWIDTNKCNQITSENYRQYAEWNLFTMGGNAE